MNRVFQICLMVLVVLTIGHVQVFGIHRGFICEDQIQPQEMDAAHCHRTNEGTDTRFVPCENSAPEPDCPNGDLSQHLEVKVKLQSAKLSDANAVTAPSFIPVATLVDIAAFEYFLKLIASQPAGSDPLHRFQEEIGKHGTASVLVAECVILLV